MAPAGNTPRCRASPRSAVLSRRLSRSCLVPPCSPCLTSRGSKRRVTVDTKEGLLRTRAGSLWPRAVTSWVAEAIGNQTSEVILTWVDTRRLSRTTAMTSFAASRNRGSRKGPGARSSWRSRWLSRSRRWPASTGRRKIRPPRRERFGPPPTPTWTPISPLPTLAPSRSCAPTAWVSSAGATCGSTWRPSPPPSVRSPCACTPTGPTVRGWSCARWPIWAGTSTSSPSPLHRRWEARSLGTAGCSLT